MNLALGLELAERGVVPAPLLRGAIRGLLRQRIRELGTASDAALQAELRGSPIAVDTDLANEQHYEVPAAFFQAVLGSHLKYSACYWPEGVSDLDAAEKASLDQVAERADLHDGQTILDLGCGWGSFSLYAARRFPGSTVLSVSNSRSQADFINARRPANLRVITADANDLSLDGGFDRIVSIEMLEHVRNYARLFERLASWLNPDGSMFVHVFCHRERAYTFETEGADNWMGRHFFSGGLMPSLDLFRSFQDHLSIEQHWALDGTHYQKTAAAWRLNLESRKEQVMEVLRGAYGADAPRWFHRWRLFFLACEELFGYDDGREWLVGHYRFRRRAR